ncbi:alpha/beta hydrolase [Pseudonocardia thermophila]|jgi:Dipeptidyl aminopeptidases/acylaminoacyl-peptidases|uniref:alpha/beta hydrolase n=1 Tax=Pseudonocardia thermophila TaxID=1848 RepID=UPI00248EE4BB|nr:alpha/beta hydrolase [Pseudonocardia thermophila]
MIETTIRGTAAGVPFLAAPPDGDRAAAPVVLTWHLLSAPNTPESFAAAIPLAGLDAWRIHLGLPISGERLPAGGAEEVMRLGYADAVRNLQYPIPRQAASEFPAALAALRTRFGIADDAPLGLVGGSAGAAALLLALAEGAPAAAAVAISPVVRLKDATDATGRTFGIAYPWDAETLALVAELDFVARAGELGDVALRIVLGSEDDAAGFHEPARALAAARPGTDLVVVEGMGHEPVPPHAARVDALAVEWLRAHLR